MKRCLEASGVESAGFDDFVNGEGKQMHDHTLAHRFDAGMYGVPTYVLEKDVFFGREHLPYIRWVLTGKRGAAPDVSNEVVS